jgi:hypothetical protein
MREVANVPVAGATAALRGVSVVTAPELPPRRLLRSSWHGHPRGERRHQVALAKPLISQHRTSQGEAEPALSVRHSAGFP